MGAPQNDNRNRKCNLLYEKILPAFLGLFAMSFTISFPSFGYQFAL